MKTKNITLEIDEETCHRARIAGCWAKRTSTPFTPQTHDEIYAERLR